MIVRVSENEYWPFYSVSEDPNAYGAPIEVPDDLVARWYRVRAEFREVQTLLQPYYSRAESPLDFGDDEE